MTSRPFWFGIAWLAALGLLLACGTPGRSWWVIGHGTITEAAAAALPEDMPPFFRAAGKQLGYLAGDPDRWKNREARFLRAAEQADHYLDLEDLEGNALPEDRYKAAAMLAKLKKSPDRVGMLPYALMEHADRLTVAFYDYREVVEKEKKAAVLPPAQRDQERARLEAERKAIEMKCIVYAGVLAHYTGDTCMPLHTTIDFDGRAHQKGPDGRKLQQGIHAKIDAFPERNGFRAEEIGRGLKPRELEDPWKHVRAEIQESFTHVERCYEFDRQGLFDKPSGESRAFILGRCQRAAQLTADLWYTAWKRSVKLPPHY